MTSGWSQWYQHLSNTPKWYYLSENFSCGEDSYVTSIEYTNGSYGSDINSIKFTCSNGKSHDFSNNGFHGPLNFSINAAPNHGIKSLDIVEHNNQVGIQLPLPPSIFHPYNEYKPNFSCRDGYYINEVNVLIPYANSNYTNRVDYIGGFQFYCAPKYPYACTFGINLANNSCREYCSENYCPSVYDYCTGDNLNNPTCQFYVTNHAPQTYDFSTQATSYCTGSNLDTDICKQYCFGNNAASTRIDCTKELQSYCSDLSVSSSVCACYRPESYYKKKLEKHFDKITNPTLKETFIEEFLAAPKYCSSFFGCSTSNYKPADATTCSLDTSVCIANTNFTNIGVFDVTCPANLNTGCVNFKTECTSTINNYLNSSKHPSTTVTTHVPITPITPTKTTLPTSTTKTSVPSKPDYKIYVLIGVGSLLLIAAIIIAIIVVKKSKKK